MSNNLKIVEQSIDTVINNAGGPGSILAANHNALLKNVLNNVGKYSGAPYKARLNPDAGIILTGILAFNGNAFNKVTDFTITFSKFTEDLTDFGVNLNTLQPGGVLKFKDYIGRAAWFYYQSHTATVDGGGNPTYEVIVKGDAANINYTYTASELESSIITIDSITAPGVVITKVIEDGERVQHKGAGLTDVTIKEVTDVFVGRFGTQWIVAEWQNTLTDNDFNNLANYNIIQQIDI